jgi:hypothetical protein
MKILRTDDVPAEIRTVNLPNTIHKLYSLNHLAAYNTIFS